MDIYEKANELMHGYGLLDLLQKYGEAYIVSTNRMRNMTWYESDYSR